MRKKHILVPDVEFKCRNYEILAIFTVGKTPELGSQGFVVVGFFLICMYCENN